MSGRNACLSGERSLGKESTRKRLTPPQASSDGSNAWIDPGYRRADLTRNTCAVNSANSAVVEVAASSALGVQTEQLTRARNRFIRSSSVVPALGRSTFNLSFKVTRRLCSFSFTSQSIDLSHPRTGKLLSPQVRSPQLAANEVFSSIMRIF